MRKSTKVILVAVILVLNAVAIIPSFFSKPAEDEMESCSKLPKIQVTEITPVILPNLLKF